MTEVMLASRVSRGEGSGRKEESLLPRCAVR